MAVRRERVVWYKYQEADAGLAFHPGARNALHRTVSQIVLLPILCTCLCAAEPDSADEGSPLLSPIRRLSSFVVDAQIRSLRRVILFAGCRVEPLTEIRDSEIQAFENNADFDAADVTGMMPEAAEALHSLRDTITSMGGTFALKSAYRPTAYQAHLHEVWVKWMKQLRNNRSSGCRALREEVGAEFRRHQLLARQQPVPASDHALGLAFDAAVAMPRGARLNGKRVTLDKLAALLGLKRPNRRRDPVHFKVLAARPADNALSFFPSRAD